MLLVTKLEALENDKAKVWIPRLNSDVDHPLVSGLHGAGSDIDARPNWRVVTQQAVGLASQFGSGH